MNSHRNRLLGVEVGVLVGFMALAMVVVFFLSLASSVVAGDTLEWDRAILRAMRMPDAPQTPVGPLWLRKWMVELTALGSGPVLTLVTAIVAGYLSVTGRAGMALFVLLSTTGGAIAGTLLKKLFLRERPDVIPHLVEVQSLSFPSAHALNSAVIYLTLGALLARAEAKPGVRIYIVGCSLLLTTCIGLSRVYLGVHYPTDVLAGWAGGAAWAAICATAARTLQHRHRLKGASGES